MKTRCGLDLPIEKVALHQARCSACGGHPPHPPGTKHQVDYFSAAESLDVIASADQKHWKLLFWVMRDTGVRIGEALRITRKDIRPDTALVGIHREKRRAKVYEYVPVSSDLYDELRWYMAGLRGQMLFPYHFTSAMVALKRAATRAGITRPVHTHMFRHGFAVNAAKMLGGEALEVRSVIQRAMGHVKPETTDIYLELTSKDAGDAIRKILD